MPTMTITKATEQHDIPIAGWDDPTILAVALMYEADGFTVSTGKVAA